jgi:Protein of unknown function (DUF2917)
MSKGSWRVRHVIEGDKGMSTASKPDGKENSIANLARNERTVTAFYKRDHRAPPAALMERPVGGWRSKITRAFRRMRENRSGLGARADHKLSKGCAKRMYLENGARILCRRGKVWITLDKGGEDILLAASESRNFEPGTRLLVEALVASRISLEAL